MELESNALETGKELELNALESTTELESNALYLFILFCHFESI